MKDFKERAKHLLGKGIEPGRVAAALGCEPSYISQLMAEEQFATEVQDAKLVALTNDSARDDKYNELEDKMLDMVKDTISNNPVAFKSTIEKVRALQVINSCKRRGIDTQNINTNIQNNVVNLIMPTTIINKYTEQTVTDINNNVVKIGEQDFITMQSAELKKAAEHLIGNSQNVKQINKPKSERDFRRSSIENFI